jgi:transposase
VFLDESGFLLVPPLARTWAPRGRTPVLHCAGHWTKISAISAISVSPRRRRLALYAHFHRHINIRAPQVVHFLCHLLRHLRGAVVLLWDRGNPHKAAEVRDFLARHPRLHTYRFPAYAPELNPGEHVWNHLKRYLANSAALDLSHLKQLIHRPLQRLRQSQQLLLSCIRASELPWP